MRTRTINEYVSAVGAIDWDRRLFDSLIPLPDGTSYNSYLVRDGGQTALIDTVDPAKRSVLLENLRGVERLDYLIAHHAEQDHSGLIPMVLEMYPAAKLICSPKAKSMLMDHVGVAEDRIRTVADGETLALGGLTLEFIHTPWVHWPETMVTFLRDSGILFSCDFFGSHVAQSDVFVTDEGFVGLAAKRYFAEIMMPFRTAIQKNLDRLKGLKIAMIAPSHGPVYTCPSFILDAYRTWTSETVRNSVLIPYISMHGSTASLVDRLVSALAGHGVEVHPFNLDDTDIGKLAMALVDAATIVIGTPAVHIGPHPRVASTVFLANALRPKLKFASIVGSYGWGHKIVDQIAAMIPNLKVELLPPVISRGMPRPADFEAVESLAGTIARKHAELGLK
jgi:flavorubredoxin